MDKSNSTAKEPALSRAYRLTLIGIGIAALATVIVTLMIGIYHPKSYRDNGPWGDFVGGTLNPILTCLTLLGVLFTIALQKAELTLTRDELSRSADALESQIAAIQKQNFEATFFQMLRTHGDIVNSIDLTSGSGVRKGRDCFEIFYARLKNNYSNARNKNNSASEASIVNDSYAKFWEMHQSELGHYFRFLFNIVRFVKSSQPESDFYIKLVRSQLSDQELLLLFYNCLSPQGTRFKQFVEEYALLDNLPISKLLHANHKSMISSNAFVNRSQVTTA
jgi:hypothetical protein